MSIIDASVLQSIGARPTGLRQPIPLYMRERLERVPVPGNFTISMQNDLSYQQVAALILEIPDFSKLRRCVFKRKKYYKN